MTTKVILSSPADNHQNVLIETLDSNGNVVAQRVITDGESTEMYVYEPGQSLRISEVPKPSSPN